MHLRVPRLRSQRMMLVATACMDSKALLKAILTS